MAACPHCGADTVGLAARMRAGPAVPFECPACGKLSCASPLAVGLAGLLSQLAMFAALIGAVVLRSWWPLVALVVCLPAAYFGAVAAAPLKALEERDVARSKAWLVGLLVAIGAATVWAFVRGS